MYTGSRNFLSSGVGLHWTPADIGAHVDTLAVTWLVMGSVTLGLLVYPLDSLVEYLADLTKSGAFFLEFIPVIGSFFVFILAANWMGSLVPWSLIELPSAKRGIECAHE